MIRYNKSIIDWFLEQQLLSSEPVNNCILFNCLEAWLITINFIHNVAINKKDCLTAWRRANYYKLHS